MYFATVIAKDKFAPIFLRKDTHLLKYSGIILHWIFQIIVKPEQGQTHPAQGMSAGALQLQRFVSVYDQGYGSGQETEGREHSKIQNYMQQDKVVSFSDTTSVDNKCCY